MQKREVRSFNKTGPCNPYDHYMLPPKERLIGAQLDRYISEKLYWVLHAPRQTGKTTFLKSWARELNDTNEVTACYTSIETCQGITEINAVTAWTVQLPRILLFLTAALKQNKNPGTNGWAGRLREILLLSVVKQMSLSQNSVSFGKGFRKSSLKPAFSIKSKVAFPKTEVLGKPQI